MMKKLGLAAVALLLSSAANAVTFDAYDSFNGTQGAGNFSWFSSSGSSVTALSSVSCVINNTICLGLPNGSDNLPGVFKSTGVPSTTHSYQPLDRLLIHPGSASALLGIFRAPTAGEYSFSATFDALTSGTSVAIFALRASGGTTNTIGTNFLDSLGESFTFSGTFELAADEAFIIGLNNGGSYASDSTGLRFTVEQSAVSAVPEPASWATMILGLGMIGAVARRRGRNTLANG